MTETSFIGIISIKRFRNRFVFYKKAFILLHSINIMLKRNVLYVDTVPLLYPLQLFAHLMADFHVK